MSSWFWNRGAERLEVTAPKLRHPTAHSASGGRGVSLDYDTVSGRVRVRGEWNAKVDFAPKDSVDQRGSFMEKVEVDQRGDRFPVRRLNRMLTMLLSEMKGLSDEGRELPMRWHIMHMYSSSQLAVVLALRRGLNPELAGIAAALHDLGLVMTKIDEGHAEAGEKHVRDFFGRYHARTQGRLSEIMEEEKKKIIEAIVRHGQKEIHSDDALVELLKDVDSLDGYLHGGKAEGARLERVLRVMKELGIEKMKMGRWGDREVGGKEGNGDAGTR